jgi:hypothetical protein
MKIKKAPGGASKMISLVAPGPVRVGISNHKNHLPYMAKLGAINRSKQQMPPYSRGAGGKLIASG